MWGDWPVPFITRFGVSPALVVYRDLAQLTVLLMTLNEQMEGVLHLCLDDDGFPRDHNPSSCPNLHILPKVHMLALLSIKKEKNKPVVTIYVYQQGKSSLAW